MSLNMERLVTMTRRHLRDTGENPFYDTREIEDALFTADREFSGDLGQTGTLPSTAGNGTVNLTAGTREYSLPTGCNLGKVDRVELLSVGEYSVLTEKPFSEFGTDESITDTATDVRNPPKNYYLRGNKIGFDPVPDTTTAAGTPLVTIYWTSYAPEVTSPATAPSTPENWRHLLAYRAAQIVSIAVDPRLSNSMGILYEQGRRKAQIQMQELSREGYPRTRVVRKY